MKKAAENISASLARKPPGSILTTKKKRPKGEIIDFNISDDKNVEKEGIKTEDPGGKANELDETFQNDKSESSFNTADNKGTNNKNNHTNFRFKDSRESSIVVVDDVTEEEIVVDSICSASLNINNNNPGSNSSNKTEPSDLPFSDMAIVEIANVEV